MLAYSRPFVRLYERYFLVHTGRIFIKFYVGIFINIGKISYFLSESN
jgi:hypothetical protein